jgi:hypothetical protein
MEFASLTLDHNSPKVALLLTRQVRLERPHSPRSNGARLLAPECLSIQTV